MLVRRGLTLSSGHHLVWANENACAFEEKTCHVLILQLYSVTCAQVSWHFAGMQGSVPTSSGTGPAVRLGEERGLNHRKRQEAILASLLIQSIASISARSHCA